jgi:hypothetical protein
MPGGSGWGSAAGSSTRSTGEWSRPPLPPGRIRCFRLAVQHVAIAGEEVALADASFHAARPEPAGYAYYVLVRRDGEWRIRAVRAFRFPRES